MLEAAANGFFVEDVAGLAFDGIGRRLEDVLDFRHSWDGTVGELLQAVEQVFGVGFDLGVTNFVQMRERARHNAAVACLARISPPGRVERIDDHQVDPLIGLPRIDKLSLHVRLLPTGWLDYLIRATVLAVAGNRGNR